MAVWTGKVALTTGVTGRDGTYLAEFLRSKGYVVHGPKSTLLQGASQVWLANKRSFDIWVTEMVEADMVAILDERERRNRQA